MTPLPPLLPPADDDEDEGGAGGELDGGAPPASYGPEAARQMAEALRAFSRNWLPLLFKVFLDTPPEARAHIGAAIAAYCTISDAALLANLFRWGGWRGWRAATAAAGRCSASAHGPRQVDLSQPTPQIAACSLASATRM